MDIWFQDVSTFCWSLGCLGRFNKQQDGFPQQVKQHKLRRRTFVRSDAETPGKAKTLLPALWLQPGRFCWEGGLSLHFGDQNCGPQDDKTRWEGVGPRLPRQICENKVGTKPQQDLRFLAKTWDWLGGTSFIGVRAHIAAVSGGGCFLETLYLVDLKSCEELGFFLNVFPAEQLKMLKTTQGDLPGKPVVRWGRLNSWGIGSRFNG